MSNIDLKNRQVSFEEGLEAAREYGLTYIEISTESEINCEYLFTRIISDLINAKANYRETIVSKMEVKH